MCLYERDGAFMGSPSGAGAALCVRAAVRSDGRGRIREIVTPVRSAMRKKRISRMWGERCRTKRRARDSPGEAREAWGAEAPGSSSARYTFGTTDRQAPWRGPRPTRRVGYSLAPFTSPPRAGGKASPLRVQPRQIRPRRSGSGQSGPANPSLAKAARYNSDQSKARGFSPFHISGLYRAAFVKRTIISVEILQKCLIKS